MKLLHCEAINCYISNSALCNVECNVDGYELGKLDKSPQTRPAGMFVTDAELRGYKISRDPIQGRYDGCVITIHFCGYWQDSIAS